MSMQTDCVYGYGFRIYAEEPRLCEFIKKHEETVRTLDMGREILDWIDNGNIDGLKEVFFDYEALEGGSGIYGIIADIIQKESGIRVEYKVADENEDDSILFPELMPWQMNEKEKSLTEESLHNLLQPYVSELNSNLEIDYIRMEFFG